MAGNTSTAVRQRRSALLDGLDDFPTPPWATRAFLAELGKVCPLWWHPGTRECSRVWEPAANRGLMAEVLREHVAEVFASDVHDYGKGYAVGSFIGAGADVIGAPWPDPSGRDWVITNPPFVLAEDFAARAFEEDLNVALLLRTAFLEGQDRYTAIFSRTPPTDIFVSVDRIPMVQGRWDPVASTATSYCWFVWSGWMGRDVAPAVHWIPPGARYQTFLVNDEAGDPFPKDIAAAVKRFRAATGWTGGIATELGDIEPRGIPLAVFAAAEPETADA